MAENRGRAAGGITSETEGLREQVKPGQEGRAPRCRIIATGWRFQGILSKVGGESNKKNKVTPAERFHI